ncbi:MAG: Lrp/AsnC family transcriptional regulator [Holophagaceae bacterium]
MDSPRLDDLDRRILSELQADARLSQAAIAARVGLSRSAVQSRIARLEACGVIAGYTLRLGSGRGRPGVRAYLLVQGSGPSHDRAVKALEAFPEVRVADSVSGDTDLVLQLEADSLPDVTRVRDEVAKLPGVAGTRTLLVMQARFDRR